MASLTPWRRTLGIALIILGFLALVTPFTPGSWLIFIGAEILGIEILSHKNVQKLLTRARERVSTFWSGR